MSVATKFEFSSVNINNDNTPYQMYGECKAQQLAGSRLNERPLFAVRTSGIDCLYGQTAFHGSQSTKVERIYENAAVEWSKSHMAKVRIPIVWIFWIQRILARVLPPSGGVRRRRGV